MNTTVSNDDLHQQAVTLLTKMKRTATEQETVTGYNERRRAATGALRPILTEIWRRFSLGETVGGFCGKEGWAKGQGITIRWAQKIIAGPKPKGANSVRIMKLQGAVFRHEDGKLYRIEVDELFYTRKPHHSKGELVFSFTAKQVEWPQSPESELEVDHL